MHEGVDNAFRVGLLAPGAKWQPLSFTAQEAELIQARTVNREEVCMVYDVKPTVIGDLTHGTYSNVFELNRDYYKTTCRVWTSLMEEVIQVQLIDPEPEWAGYFVAFDFSEVLRGDRKAEIDAAVAAYTGGLATQDEARGWLKLAATGHPEANVLHRPSNNMTPLGSAPAGQSPALPTGQ